MADIMIPILSLIWFGLLCYLFAWIMMRFFGKLYDEEDD